jgi:hypothetical protein
MTALHAKQLDGIVGTCDDINEKKSSHSMAPVKGKRLCDERPKKRGYRQIKLLMYCFSHSDGILVQSDVRL